MAKKQPWEPDRKVNHQQGIRIDVHRLIFVAILLPLIPMIVPYPYTWDAGHISYSLQCSILALLATMSTPYTKLRLKSLLAAFCAFSWLDVALYPLRYLMAPYIVYAVEVAIAFIFLLYIYNKWYDSRSEPLDDEHLFIVSKSVNSWKELLVSLFCSNPQGGFSIYAKGNWYHYRKRNGVIEKTNGDVLKSLASNYIFQSYRLANLHDIKRLESMVGDKWTPLKNCITEFRSLDRG